MYILYMIYNMYVFVYIEHLEGARAEPEGDVVAHALQLREEHPRPWFRVQGSGLRVQGAGCRVQGSGFRVETVEGGGFRV